MSGVAGLYNVPTTAEELATWSALHARHHADINREVAQKTGVDLPAYILDPFDPNNMQVWLDQHQDLHTRMDAVMSISGFNLDSVEWTDENERAGWVFLNGQEHYTAAAILGIG